MASASYPNLFSERTTDGNSPAKDFRTTRRYQGGNTYTVYAYGTWDGATVKFQGSLDGNYWIDIVNASYTVDRIDNLILATNYIRAVISGAGASTSLNVHIK